jgi:hypothetical protein
MPDPKSSRAKTPFLVATLPDAEWLLCRYSLADAKIWDYHGTDDCVRDNPNGKGLNFIRCREYFPLLQRRVDSAQRTFHRALHDLERTESALLLAGASLWLGLGMILSFAMVEPVGPGYDKAVSRPPGPCWHTRDRPTALLALSRTQRLTARLQSPLGQWSGARRRFSPEARLHRRMRITNPEIRDSQDGWKRFALQAAVVRLLDRLRG